MDWGVEICQPNGQIDSTGRIKSLDSINLFTNLSLNVKFLPLGDKEGEQYEFEWASKVLGKIFGKKSLKGEKIKSEMIAGNSTNLLLHVDESMIMDENEIAKSCFE